MRLLEDADLSERNTLKVPSRARFLLEIESLKGLHALDDPRFRGLRRLVLGGGSNVILDPFVDALVLRAALRGVEMTRFPDALEVTVGAGEPWPALVRQLVEQGIGGLENLAMIPGDCGGAPVQNIGAYGLELCQRLKWVQALNLQSGRLHRISPADCQFGYRDSLFKREPERWLILTIRLRLPLPWTPLLGYPGIDRLADDGPLTPERVFAAVSALRRQKLPDPELIPNAGSFFKNPEVSPAHAAALLQQSPALPTFKTSAADRIKLSAAWLIDACGWRGRALGAVAVSAQHALVLTNPNRASAAEILALADAIAADVQARFGIALEREPVRLQ